jgi:hypothetical protein
MAGIAKYIESNDVDDLASAQSAADGYRDALQTYQAAVADSRGEGSD